VVVTLSFPETPQTGAKAMNVSYEECDTGQWHPPEDDQIATKQVGWRESQENITAL